MVAFNIQKPPTTDTFYDLSSTVRHAACKTLAYGTHITVGVSSVFFWKNILGFVLRKLSFGRVRFPHNMPGHSKIPYLGSALNVAWKNPLITSTVASACAAYGPYSGSKCRAEFNNVELKVSTLFHQLICWRTGQNLVPGESRASYIRYPHCEPKANAVPKEEQPE